MFTFLPGSRSASLHSDRENKMSLIKNLFITRKQTLNVMAQEEVVSVISPRVHLIQIWPQTCHADFKTCQFGIPVFRKSTLDVKPIFREFIPNISPAIRKTILHLIFNAKILKVDILPYTNIVKIDTVTDDGTSPYQNTCSAAPGVITDIQYLDIFYQSVKKKLSPQIAKTSRNSST